VAACDVDMDACGVELYENNIKTLSLQVIKSFEQYEKY
jgi:hypothetical protein